MSETSNAINGSTPSTTPDPGENDSTRNTFSNRRRNNNRNTNNIQVSNPRSYEGSNSDIGAVIGLKHEQFDKKVPFQVFMDKLSTFSISNLKEGGDLTPFFQELKDPIPEFNSLYKPSPPTTLDEVEEDENAGNDDDSIDSAELALERDIYKEEVKAFVARRNLLKRNMRKLFGLIWGQCSSALQAKVKGISCYTGMTKKIRDHHFGNRDQKNRVRNQQ